jgi:hypothetical protein
MSNSRPFDLVFILKNLWASHPKNAGRIYGGTSRDLREAKEFLQVNDFDPGDITELSERFNRFMQSTFDAWAETDYPIWGFLKHYNRYGPPRKTINEVVKKNQPTVCPHCGTDHPSKAECPPKEYWNSNCSSEGSQ